jgi:hypothetical protein
LVNQKVEKMRLLSFLLLVAVPPACQTFVVSGAFSFRQYRPTNLPAHKQDVDDSTCMTLKDTFDRRSFLPFLATMILSPALASAKDLKEDYRQGTAALAGMDADAPVPREAYKKLPSGVVYADLRKGSGETATEGSRANLQWVLRRSNGYFVDSSERNESVPFIFTIGDGKAIKGIDEAVRGMQVGGVRRIIIPPSLAYVEGLEDGKPGPLPYGFGPRQQMRRTQNVRKDVPGEFVFLEVQLTRMR